MYYPAQLVLNRLFCFSRDRFRAECQGFRKGLAVGDHLDYLDRYYRIPGMFAVDDANCDDDDVDVF